MIDKMDILLTKDMVKEIDMATQRVENKAKSCETRSIIIDFDTVHKFIKKAGPMIAEMRLKDQENKEVLEIARNIASIDKRYSDARYEFENNCLCMDKSIYRNLREEIKELRAHKYKPR